MRDKKRIALYGGAFDPITHAHLEVAQKTLAYVDEVWLMPCYVSYHAKTMTPATHRVNMCRKAIASAGMEARVRVCEFEIQHQLQGETIDVMTRFLEVMPAAHYVFVIGMDNANHIVTWSGWQTLIEMLPFLVFPRTGYTANTNIMWYTQKPHCLVTTHIANAISSTKVRQALQKKGNSHYIAKSVAAYIHQHGLYEAVRINKP